MSFETFNFHPSIMAGVRALGYVRPTPIQIQSIPPIMQGRDLIGLDQTGTGKTAAFVLRKSSFSRAVLRCCFTEYIACDTVAAGAVRPICTVTGSCRISCTSRRISPGMVAEKRSVCRLCIIHSKIPLTLGRKPISNIRSASSITRTSRWDRLIVPFHR